MSTKSHDRGICLHCGGEVGDDGYSRSDKDDAPAQGPANPAEVDDVSSQFEQNRKMRHAALASALKGK